MKKVVILGSTGSIGINTLKVIQKYPKKFKVIGLSAYNNYKLLENQIKIFKPSFVGICPEHVKYLKRQITRQRIKYLNVHDELEVMTSLKNVDVVVLGMRGSAALKPFLSAVSHGKTVAPANKEALVIGGRLLMQSAKKHNAKIIPIDSEQSAIFQCLDGRNPKELFKILLTASGGTLLKHSKNSFNLFSVKQILNHPRWKMGKKITVDSATLMNKGFEIIEAMRLFDLKVDDIEVVIHPEAIIHSMVEFIDGSIIAQLGITDMRLPIQYALTYPERLKTGLKRTDFFELKNLNFEKPDLKKFPSLALCMYVGKKDGTLPSVLNAADEEAVDAFLEKRIRLTDIHRHVEKVVMKHKVKTNPTLKDILDADQWAREETNKLIMG